MLQFNLMYNPYHLNEDKPMPESAPEYGAFEPPIDNQRLAPHPAIRMAGGALVLAALWVQKEDAVQLTEEVERQVESQTAAKEPST